MITSNYRGYIGRWEVIDRRLFLTGLVGPQWMIPERLIGDLPADPDPYRPETAGCKTLRLNDLFPGSAPLVPASWVTGRLVIATGPMEVYCHRGFDSLYQSYRLLYVVQGRIASERRMSGRDWARRNGMFWPEVDWFERNERSSPGMLVFPAPESAAARELAARRAQEDDDDTRSLRSAAEDDAREWIRLEADLYHWSDVADPSVRYMYYMADQERRLERGCGVTPGREPWLTGKDVAQALARRVGVRAEAARLERLRAEWAEEGRLGI